MKIVIDIPQGMIDAFSHEEQWTAVLCKDMNDVLQNGTPYEERPKGKWVKSSNMSKRSYQRLCSNCKHIVYFCGDGNYPNCPYCLADMGGKENDHRR